MQELRQGSVLQGGKYRIERMLGQGGFGITYEGIQTGLNRRVAIKEFFMKEYCNRDTTTSVVSVGSAGSADMVDEFRQKFLKEAQLIARLEDAPHVVRIHDIFEENGTAYYVMEFLGGGSLNSLLKERGQMSEPEAIAYIREVGEALTFLHTHNTLHLDVKPSNILLNKKGEVVLIDFGVSKHYDQSGSQTSSTPVGLSKGYAPTEQYQSGGVQQFTPATDVYSLGATLYCLLTGQAPPEASVVFEDGLPPRPQSVSASTWQAITQAMQPRRKDRTQTVAQFIADLGAGYSETAIPQKKHEEPVIVKSEETVVSKPQPAVASSEHIGGLRDLALIAALVPLAIEATLYVNIWILIIEYGDWAWSFSDSLTILFVLSLNTLTAYGLTMGYGLLRRGGKVNVWDLIAAVTISVITWYLFRYYLGGRIFDVAYGMYGFTLSCAILPLTFLLLAANSFVFALHIYKLRPNTDWTRWVSTGGVVLLLVSFLGKLFLTLNHYGFYPPLFVNLFVAAALTIVMAVVMAMLWRKSGVKQLKVTTMGRVLMWIQSVGVATTLSILIAFSLFLSYNRFFA